MSVQRRNIETVDEDSATNCEIAAKYLSLLIAIITFPISIFICTKFAYEYERAVIFRLGRLRNGGARGPGVFFILPCIDDYFNVDLRTESIAVYPQDILTKDSVSIKIDAVIFFRMENPLLGLLEVGNYKYSTMLLAQSMLRNVVGTKTLGELMSEREEVSHLLQQLLDKATEIWGVKVERIEIRDVRLPIALQRSMAAEAEAKREAKAKIIAAEGEKNAANSLREASNIMSSSPAAVQLRYLQTLRMISTEQSSSIIVPIPCELAKVLINWVSGSICTCDE